ncbi:ATP-binding cassette domain-containing protein [Mangrovivirga sp. M17]|uniref:ATP-binding cassette domain-containing protein n=1 Tax=Mangrovivirga halotolerans TaxID=2993936 RepID=A0ABT3RR24_9BACT|nr:ATP-binding cassette domain-containing protein [Mangrovivirga halotolerans]MCX2744227.1 ATP-binding cassette domain-containing protein [Mangrovivirga halotolerans]
MVSIHFENVSKSFDKTQAISNLSFKADKSQKIVFLGTSGSGKTTGLRLINKLITLDSGDIYINGTSIKNIDPVSHRRKIGYVIQKGGLFPHKTVEENILTIPKLVGMDEKIARERLTQLLKLIKLENSYLDKMPAQLSGGEQQRVGIARALISQANLILMDEPFGALDPITADSVLRDFLAIQDELKFTAVIVTHNIMEAIKVSDLIILLHKGKLQQKGSAKDLLFNPSNDFVRSFFNSNRFELELEAIILSDLKPYISQEVISDLGEELSVRECMNKGLHREQLLKATEEYKANYNN